MTKYLAILRDSLREALDTKVLYFTVGLSLLTILLLGSLSFRPVPMEEQLSRATEMMTFLSDLGTQGRGPRYTVAEFEQTNPQAAAWQGDYRYVFVMSFGAAEDAQQVRKSNLITAEAIERDLAKSPWVKKVEAKELPATDPKEFRFQVRTWATENADRRDWVHEPALFFGLLPMSIFQTELNDQIIFIADYLIGTWGAGVTMLLSTIVTAFFIPNMLRKGTIDMLLAKPVYRSSLLVYKFIGGLTFMFLNTLIILAGVWLVLGLRTGVWINSLLLCVFVFTFQFAIFYSISTLMAVTTRSPIAVILVTVAAWPLLSGIGWGYRYFDARRPDLNTTDLREQRKAWHPAFYTTFDVLHFVTPRYKDFDVLTSRLIRKSLLTADSRETKETDKEYASIRWDESLIITVLFIAILLGLSCWWFATRDY
ncbi:MAG: ABC transporter permease subunit [Planctomycetia bacterium]|nr:ABC transporter permease subunit [Planctomycetia bacterium]